MNNTHKVTFDNAFEATQFSMVVETLGAEDISVALEDAEYVVEYSLEDAVSKLFNAYMESKGLDKRASGF